MANLNCSESGILIVRFAIYPVNCSANSIPPYRNDLPLMLNASGYLKAAKAHRRRAAPLRKLR
jgi:hypothetical protein